MGSHRTDKRRLLRLQNSLNQQARILQLQSVVHTIQAVGNNVTAPADTQQVHDGHELSQAPQPVLETETANRTPFPVATALPSVSPLTSVDSVSPIEDIKGPDNQKVVRVNVLQPSQDGQDKHVIDLESSAHSTSD